MRADKQSVERRLAIVRDYARQIASCGDPLEAQRLASEMYVKIKALRSEQLHALLHDERLYPEASGSQA